MKPIDLNGKIWKYLAKKEFLGDINVRGKYIVISIPFTIPDAKEVFKKFKKMGDPNEY